jgi:hypothetical protein
MKKIVSRMSSASGSRRAEFFKKDYERHKSKYSGKINDGKIDDDMTPFVVFEAVDEIIKESPTNVSVIRCGDVNQRVAKLSGSSYFDSIWWDKKIKQHYQDKGWKVEYGLYESDFRIKWPQYTITKIEKEL